MVQTVTGPQNVAVLGVTLPHEHLFLDLSCLWHAPKNPQRAWIVEAPVTSALYEDLQRDPYHSRDNLRLDDFSAVAEEVGYFRDQGGGAVVDLSTATIGPYPQELSRLSRATGVRIIAGTGYYVQPAHPPWIRHAAWEDVYESMLRDLQEGFPGTSVRAGVIGELGTSSPIHPDEMKVLKAAAHVQRNFPVAINVHLAIFGREGLAVVDALEAWGADLTRVALSHLDENPDPVYHAALAKRGVRLEFDTWGSECVFEDGCQREPSDGDRLTALIRLVDQGFLDQVLLSQDVCTKMQWHRYGGRGYDHLLGTVVPTLRDQGFSLGEIERLIIGNPARLLVGA